MDDDPERLPVPDRRFERWSVPIVAAGVVVFTWYLTLGRSDLLAQRTYSNFFDLQARAMFHGRLSVPAGSLAYEGFVRDGHTYTYFGIFPSLLRAPVLLVTNRFDGRLTTLSMVAGYLVAMTSAVLLIRRVRQLAAPDTRWSTTGLAVALTMVAVVGIGSNLLFLATGAWVYNEAELWGVAAVLASFAATIGYLLHDRWRDVAFAGLWAGVAWLTRGSMGLAPTIVLGALAVVRLFPTRWLTPFAPPPTTFSPRRIGDRRRAIQLAIAALVPMALFSAVNVAKFDSPTAIPVSAQVGSHRFPGFVRALDEYDGSLFSVRVVPTTLLHALRPDLVKPTGAWPFVTFSGHSPINIGGVVFAAVEPSSGLTVTVPALLALGAIGCIPMLKRRRRDGVPGSHRFPDLAPLRPFLLGGAAAAGVPLTLAFIAQRYWSDALPLLIVAAAAGVAVIDHMSRARSPRGSRVPTISVAAIALLAVLGVFVTLSTTWDFQRFVIPPDEAARAAALRTQAKVAKTFHTPSVAIRQVDALPPKVVPRQVVVVGRCAGLYYGIESAWAPVELTPAVGAHRLHVSWPRDLPRRTLSPVLSVRRDAETVKVALQGMGEQQVRAVVLRNGQPDGVGRAIRASTTARHLVEIRASTGLNIISINIDGRLALLATRGDARSGSSTLPVTSVGRFPGRVVAAPARTPTCDALVRGKSGR